MIKVLLYLSLALLWCCNAAEIGGRIIGGRVAHEYDAFCVTIYSIPVAEGSDAYLTSGVAISPKLVLGTAQAVKKYDDVIRDYIEFAEHIIGFNSGDMAQQDVYKVTDVAIHPDYDYRYLTYNVAVFHLPHDLIDTYLPFEFSSDKQIPNAVKVLGYGAPDHATDYSRTLLTTIGYQSTDCIALLNSLVFGPTNYCLHTENELAQSDQGGAITNSWLTPDDISLFGIISYWTKSNPSTVVITNLRHPDIENFIYNEYSI